MFKRFLSAFLISLMVLTSGAFAYVDVERTSPYYYAIEYLRRNDVFKDGGLFRPNVIISRSEFIKYLVKLNNPDFKPRSVTPNLPFTDTKNSTPYAPYFQEAIRLGILDTRDTTVKPYSKITVFEALTLLFHSRTIPIPRRWVGPIPYKDVEKNKSITPLIMRSIQLGIVEPQSADKFGVYRRLNKAQAAHIIYRMDLVDLRTNNATAPSTSTLTADPHLQKIISVWQIIQSSYINKNDINFAELTDATLRSLIEALDDPYSSYLDQEENAAFNDDLDGQIEGIGAYIDQNEKGEVTIVAPIKDSPAFHAGVKSGDVILKIDGKSAKDISLHEAVGRIKGPKGTKVTLTLRRNGMTLDITITRDLVTINALEYEFIENGTIIHVKLFQFSGNLIDQFQEVADITDNNAQVKGMILDLRDNPGGLLSASVNLMGYFLERQTPVVSIEYSFFNNTQYARGRAQLKDIPLVVLINKGSASASEIVAGAIQDHKRGKVIGETSFGKGTVQEINYFPDNSSLKLTVARWLTPNKKSIAGNGIRPDIVITNPTASTIDHQLNRAIVELKKQF